MNPSFARSALIVASGTSSDEQGDERHPREHAARHHDPGDPRPDDVADARGTPG